MYKLTDKYIASQFISKVIMTIIVFIVIFLLVDIVEHLDYIIDSKISRIEIARYFMYSIPWYSTEYRKPASGPQKNLPLCRGLDRAHRWYLVAWRLHGGGTGSPARWGVGVGDGAVQG